MRELHPHARVIGKRATTPGAKRDRLLEPMLEVGDRQRAAARAARADDVDVELGGGQREADAGQECLSNDAVRRGVDVPGEDERNIDVGDRTLYRERLRDLNEGVVPEGVRRLKMCVRDRDGAAWRVDEDDRDALLGEVVEVPVDVRLVTSGERHETLVRDGIARRHPQTAPASSDLLCSEVSLLGETRGGEHRRESSGVVVLPNFLEGHDIGGQRCELVGDLGHPLRARGGRSWEPPKR